jgi:hypothetical protein
MHILLKKIIKKKQKNYHKIGYKQWNKYRYQFPRQDILTDDNYAIVFYMN